MLLPEGINLDGLPPVMALRLGVWTGEQVKAAEQRGWQNAIDALRDADAFEIWYRNNKDWKKNQAQIAADYLEFVAVPDGD